MVAVIMIKSTYGTMYYVESMEKAVKYFKHQLGIAPTQHSPDWTEFDLGGHKLCLHAKKMDQQYRENGILILNLDGIKKAFEKMKAEGLNVYGLNEVHPGAWTFNLQDPSGNEFSFYGKP